MEKWKKIMLICLVSAIVLFSMAVGIFFLSFKTDFKDIATKYASEFDVDVGLVMAVIKAESKFDKNALSRANAVGLMQVKLETANYMLQKLGEQQICQAELFDPQTNIKLGTKYLQYLIGRFENVEVSICAYNAGETVVASWLADRQYSKDGKTLCKIPFAETQNYLKKVLRNKKVYDFLI